MRALKLITGHLVYNPAYNSILQTKETLYSIWQSERDAEHLRGAQWQKNVVHRKSPDRLESVSLTLKNRGGGWNPPIGQVIACHFS